jgi:LysM repeat protein
MQKTNNNLLVFLLLISTTGIAQKNELFINYINTYKDLAITEMKRTGVPAAITLAQGILESGAGNSELVLASNNHFGIKCKSYWKGETVKHDDDEKGECFRKYPSPEDSYKDHSDFLKNGQRYAFLFSLEPTDYIGWSNGLQKAGYATNPKYPQSLVKLIEDYNLQNYTLLAIGNASDMNADNAHKGIGGFKSMGAIFSSGEKASQENVPEKMVKVKPVTNNFPEGQFKINDTKVVFVKKGTSYLSIAKQYDIDLSKIFEFNEIQRDEITNADQLIYLQRKRKTGNNEYHAVQPGESLHDIAQKEAIRIESLQELNWLKEEDKPAVGEKLSLRSKSHSIPKLAVKENYSLVPASTKHGSN